MRTFAQAAWLAGVLYQPIDWAGGRVPMPTFLTRCGPYIDAVNEDMLAYGVALGVSDADMTAVKRRFDL